VASLRSNCSLARNLRGILHVYKHEMYCQRLHVFLFSVNGIEWYINSSGRALTLRCGVATNNSKSMPSNKCAHCKNVPPREADTLTLSPSEAAYESMLAKAEARLGKFGSDVAAGIGNGAKYTGQGVGHAALYAGRKIGHAASVVGHDIHDLGVSARNHFSKNDAIDPSAWDVGLGLDLHSATSRIRDTPNSLSPEFHDFLRDSTAPNPRPHSARSHHASSLLAASKTHKSHYTHALVANQAKAHARVGLGPGMHAGATHHAQTYEAKMHALAQTRALHEVAQAEKIRAHAVQTHANSHAYALQAQAAQDAHAHAQTNARFNSLSHAHAQAQTQAHYRALAHAEAAAHTSHSGGFGMHPYNQSFY